MAQDTRANAAQVLGEVIAGKSLNQVLPAALATVSPRDRGLLQELCYGSLRQAPRLQGVLRQLLQKPLREKDRDVQGLLLCGLYQLDAMRVPDHAAVSATVGATRTLNKGWAKGLSNAVLRRYQRERESLLAALTESERAAHPPWLYAAIRAQWPEQAEEILAANNAAPPMTLRINAARIDRDSYLALLTEANIQAHPGLLSDQAIYLQSAVDVADLPGFDDGLVSVQDEAAQLAAALLAARPGDRILDACAAPGGKTCHILELLQPGSAELIATDADPRRLERVEENLQRLQLQASVRIMDASQPPADLEPGFDRILVDAPCSASGVIRRHPDIKLLRRQADIGSFARQQSAILAGLWPLLKPGGRLLYASCSILTEENDAVIDELLQRQNDTTVLPIPQNWGSATRHGRQLLPARDKPDGLFYALLQKQ